MKKQAGMDLSKDRIKGIVEMCIRIGQEKDDGGHAILALAILGELAPNSSVESEISLIYSDNGKVRKDSLELMTNSIMKELGF
ncbi:hypothetical protein KBD75_03135 [Candidatus Woesebacteria bacterium]|nr:hypothetical protein [Candidatus Woesebacteria bacterium]